MKSLAWKLIEAFNFLDQIATVIFEAVMGERQRPKKRKMSDPWKNVL